jgi:hypothetical protein
MYHKAAAFARTIILSLAVQNTTSRNVVLYQVFAQNFYWAPAQEVTPFADPFMPKAIAVPAGVFNLADIFKKVSPLMQDCSLRGLPTLVKPALKKVMFTKVDNP